MNEYRFLGKKEPGNRRWCSAEKEVRVVVFLVVSWAGMVHCGVESALVSHVLDGPDSAVGFLEGVLALHHVSVAILVLWVHVPGVVVTHSVRKVVVWVCLQQTIGKQMQ